MKIDKISQVIEYIRLLILSIVTHPSSIRFISDFQYICGVSKNKKTNAIHTNLIIHFFFKFASSLGEDIFYCIPFLIWIAIQLSKSFLTNFFIILITGQLLKELFKIPRPCNINSNLNKNTICNQVG